MKMIAVEDVFKNPKYIRYKVLFQMLYTYSDFVNVNPERLKLKHLRVLLCKNHGLKIKDSEIPDYVKTMVSPAVKFPNPTELSHALKRLIDLGLIERKSDSKETDFYSITALGYCKHQRDFIHTWIDENYPDEPEKLRLLSRMIMEKTGKKIKKMEPFVWGKKEEAQACEGLGVDGS
jgi:hypothetical protein